MSEKERERGGGGGMEGERGGGESNEFAAAVFFCKLSPTLKRHGQRSHAWFIVVGRPTNFKDSLNQLACASEEEHKLVTAQAAKDWEMFLLLRAEELQLGISNQILGKFFSVLIGSV